MRFFWLITFFFIGLAAYAQEVIVLEKGTNIPMAYVAIYNKTKTISTVTTGQGKANLSRFSSEDIIIIKHISHLEVTTTKAKIIAAGGKVYLIPDENKLNEIVLSVSRFSQRKQEVPQQIESLNTKDITFTNPQTSADLLERTGKVYVQKSQLGGGSPMIRGFSTNRLLITVDGVRMNTAIFRGGNIQSVISIDPLSVQRTEVILGPGSVVFGSDAIGGVMNFYTLDPKFSFVEGTSFSGNAFTRYSTASNEKTAHVDFNFGRKKWAFLSGITYSDFGDLRMGSHGPDEYLRPNYAAVINGEDRILNNSDPRVQVPTGYNQLNLLQKVRFMPNENWDFKLGLIYSTTSDFPRYDRLYQTRNGQLRSAEWNYGPQTWFSGNVQAMHTGYGNLYDNAKFTIAYQFFEESRFNRDFNNETLFSGKEEVDAYSANFDFEKKIKSNKLFYGVEYVLNNVGSESARTNIVTNISNPDFARYPNGSSWQSLAAYSSYQWQINKDLSLQSGLRYNHIFLNADFDEVLFELPYNDANLSTGALTGSAGLSWKAKENLVWKLNLSTAFRAPNIDDVGKIFDSEPGSVVVPNPNLKPEYAYNAEIGLNWQLSEIFKIDVAGFYTHLDNALIRRDFSLNGRTTLPYQGEISNIQAIQNASNAYVYGFEAGLEITLSSQVYLVSQLTLTKGIEEQEDGSNVPLRHAAPLFGNTHVVWEFSKFKFDIFSQYNGEFSFEDLAPSEQAKAFMYAIDENGNPYAPSWYTLNFTGQYSISNNWVMTASLENITDQRYRTYSSGITAPGRNLILAVKYSF